MGHLLHPHPSSMKPETPNHAANGGGASRWACKNPPWAEMPDQQYERKWLMGRRSEFGLPAPLIRGMQNPLASYRWGYHTGEH
jgi:hypothetical protein